MNDITTSCQNGGPGKFCAPGVRTLHGTLIHYTVLACADGWLAYSISDEGARALQLGGGNAWYQIARLQNGRFLADFQQEWSSVFNWKFQALNDQGLTPQQAMDKQFADNGIPNELRPQLVGEGPAAG